MLRAVLCWCARALRRGAACTWRLPAVVWQSKWHHAVYLALNVAARAERSEAGRAIASALRGVAKSLVLRCLPLNNPKV